MRYTGLFGVASQAAKSARIAQIRLLGRVLILMSRSSRLGRRVILRARDNRLTGPVLRWLLAFNGTFSNLAEATRYAARYIPMSHEHPGQSLLHAKFAEVTRESDYPVLFFLAPVVSEFRTVFDLGGSVGNLFFQLHRHLKFDDKLVWTICDLPVKKNAALEFAKARCEDRIKFTDEFSFASGVDLFLVVGALHYFERGLADLLSDLPDLPKHVIINRSPFCDAKEIVVVQDGGLWLNACKLHDAKELVRGMRGLGYEFVASWPVHERILHVPLEPEYHEPFRGFYFRLQDGSKLRSEPAA